MRTPVLLGGLAGGDTEPCRTIMKNIWQQKFVADSNPCGTIIILKFYSYSKVQHNYKVCKNLTYEAALTIRRTSIIRRDEVVVKLNCQVSIHCDGFLLFSSYLCITWVCTIQGQWMITASKQGSRWRSVAFTVGFTVCNLFCFSLLQEIVPDLHFQNVTNLHKSDSW